MVLNKQAERIERQHHHQHRNEQIKGVFDHRRHLIRQANTDIVRLQETHHFNAVHGHQNRRKNPRAAEAIDRQGAVRFWRRHQQKSHNGQHAAHEGIELMGLLIMLAEVIRDRGANVDRHNAHRHIKRRQNPPFKLFRQIQPGACKPPGGIRRKRRVGKDQQE